MRWFKRSARDNIMKDIHLGRKGGLGGGQNYGRQYYQEPSRSSGSKWIMAIVIIAILVIGTFALIGFGRTAQGRLFFGSIGEFVESIAIEPILRVFSGAQEFGAGEFFDTNVNTSSREKGLILNDFDLVSEGVIVPAGASFDLRYDIKFVNVEQSSIETTFFCEIDLSEDDESYIIEGEIIPEKQFLLQRGANVFCRINGADTKEINDEVFVDGWFEFPFETPNAKIPVYFVPGDVADQTEDFFKEYGLDVAPKDLRVTYNGEPIGVAIETGGAGNEEQPVIVRSGDIQSFNVVGIKLKNIWDGDIVSLDEMELILPEGVTLDDELNQYIRPDETVIDDGEIIQASDSCPFESAGTYRGDNVYTMSEAAKDDLFAKYFSDNPFFEPSEFFGKTKSRRFQCWIEIDDGIFNGAPFAQEEYVVNLQYTYSVKKKVKGVVIKAREEELVPEDVLT